MLGQIVNIGIPSKHILFNCWFAYPTTIVEIAKIRLNVVARLKNTPKVKCLLDGEKRTLFQIYSLGKKHRGRSRYLLSVCVKLYNQDNEMIDARIIYVRDRNNRKKWIALISTDMELSEKEIIQLYGKRWDIEVFFKVCKSYLKLSKECNSLSYDAMIAHTAVVFARYMMLAVENREASDLRTLGEIFYCLSDEMSDISLIQAFHLLMQVPLDKITDKLSLTSEQLDQLLEAFMAAILKNLRKDSHYVPKSVNLDTCLKPNIEF